MCTQQSVEILRKADQQGGRGVGIINKNLQVHFVEYTLVLQCGDLGHP